MSSAAVANPIPGTRRTVAKKVYPIYGMRADTPETAALVVMVFYGGLHAIYLLLAVATIVLSLAMKR